MTNRAILLFLLAGLLMLLFSTVIPASWGFALFNGFWLFFVVWDYFLTPGSSFFKISRNCPDKLSIDADNRIEVSVENRSLHAVCLSLKDDNPFRQLKMPLKVKVKPQSTEITEYYVRPYKRGEYQFGFIWVRVSGLLGLIIRQFRVDLGRSVKVYPNIAQIKNYDLFSLRGRLLEIGMKPSKIYGVGMEFESLREYHRDDAFRRISWKATARKGRIIVKNYEVERSQNLLVALDVGRMMMAEIANMAKIDYAINAALLLCYVALKGDDRVGLLTFSRYVKRYVPPGRGKKQLHLILDALQKTEASLDEPDMGSLVRFIGVKNKKRSLIVIFTDLADVEISDETIKYLRSLHSEHLPLCVLISDPTIQFVAEASCNNSRDLYRKAVAEDILFQRDMAINNLRRQGVLVLEAPPGKLSSALVNKYLEMKLKGKL